MIRVSFRRKKQTRRCRHEHWRVMLVRIASCGVEGCQRRKHASWTREMALCLSCGLSSPYNGPGYDQGESLGKWGQYTFTEVGARQQ